MCITRGASGHRLSVNLLQKSLASRMFFSAGNLKDKTINLKEYMVERINQIRKCKNKDGPGQRFPNGSSSTRDQMEESF